MDYLPNSFKLRYSYHNMASKIVCDICGKDFPEDQTYEVKSKNRNTKTVLVTDICHPCFVDEKGSFAKIPKKWKKWNTEQKAYVDAS